MTINSARLLRIPGTENNKQDTPRPVTLAGNPLDFDYDPDHLWQALEPYKVALPAARRKSMPDPALFPPRPPIRRYQTSLAPASTSASTPRSISTISLRSVASSARLSPPAARHTPTRCGTSPH